jgi:hypothetical protein
MTPPREIPIGGDRQDITREDLAVARGMPGGLLEPTWLPDGFELVHVTFDVLGDAMRSVDLTYLAGLTEVHVWQTNIPPEELGPDDPVALGEPFQGTGWNAQVLPVEQVGQQGVVEYATRLPDDRTVSVLSDLQPDVMRRILDSMQLRSDSDAP